MRKSVKKNHEDDSENEDEKYVNEFKKIFDLAFCQDHYFLMEKVHLVFQKEEHLSKTPFYWRIFLNIFTTVKDFNETQKSMSEK